MRRIQCTDRSQWLGARKLGGSDAGVINGSNRYKSITDLYLEKIGAKEPADLSNNKRVQHGVASEPLLREIFKINFPEYEMYYREYEVLIDDEFDFLSASLDGELYHPKLGHGVWEAKTTEPRNRKAWQQWSCKVPDSYFCQLLHNMMVAGYQYAILTAQLIHRPYGDDIDDLLWTETRNYFFWRNQYEDDIAYLRSQEVDFWINYVIPRREPNVRLRLGE